MLNLNCKKRAKLTCCWFWEKSCSKEKPNQHQENLFCYCENKRNLHLLVNLQNRRDYLAPEFLSHFRFIFSPFLARCWWMTTFITLVLALFTFAPCIDAVTPSQAKLPLIKTDAATTKGIFRTFIGLGPITSDSFSIPDSNSPEPLDFQGLHVVERWGDYTTNVLLVSGRNSVYMINATSTLTGENIRYIERLKWSSESAIQEKCLLMGKGENACNNFIRVVELQVDGRLLVCGTNSYAPTCRYYDRSHFNLPSASLDSYFSSEVACKPRCEVPYNPNTMSATLYANTSYGFQLFSAVINDFIGKKPVLMRKDHTYVYSMDRWFNDPSFIKLVEYKDGKMYLFFRETATAVETGADSPVTYARVAQVCKNDPGGTTVLRAHWTTFLKARLRCASDRDQSFAFNNLTSVSEITTIEGEHEPMDVIFATFTTPWNWDTIPMSAVCVFSMDTIKYLFEQGNFLEEQESRPVNSNGEYDQSFSAETILRAVPVPEYSVPIPRPGSCLLDNIHMSDETLSFAKSHFLMYEPVDPLYQKTMFVSQTDVRATQIAVDNNAGANNKVVIYVGTEDGRILRIRPRLNQNVMPKSVLLEEMQIINQSECASGSIRCSVLDLHIVRPDSSNQYNINEQENQAPSIFVAFADRITQVALATCKDYANENCCNADPECGWWKELCVVRVSASNTFRPPISELNDFPVECQKLSSSEPLQVPGCNCSRNSDSHQRCNCSSRGFNSHDHRLSQEPYENSINDQPKMIDPCIVQPCATSRGSNKRQHGGSTDMEIAILFTQHVLPFVSEEFRDVLGSLARNEKQQLALTKQLQEALIVTAELVIRNHKQEYCLPSHSVNSLTHAYPLLLREIDAWHETVLKRMNATIFIRECWESKRKNNPCTARVSFTATFPPTLWEPLTQLLQEFNARCDALPIITDDSETNGCFLSPRSRSCKNETNPNCQYCQPKQCIFPNNAVDVKAFFRHANDSRESPLASKGKEPLWKLVKVVLNHTNVIKGHLELFVSKTQPFLIQYFPVTEKIKITFHYAAEHQCNFNEPVCAGSASDCNQKLQISINHWFAAAMQALKPAMRKCRSQINKFHKSNKQKKPKSNHRARRTSINEHINTPVRCLLIKKRISRGLQGQLWDQVINRAERIDGVQSDVYTRIEFYSVNHIKEFFNNDCSSGSDSNHANLGKSVIKAGGRRSRNVNVAIFASHDMPFVIEKKKTFQKSEA